MLLCNRELTPKMLFLWILKKIAAITARFNAKSYTGASLRVICRPMKIVKHSWFWIDRQRNRLHDLLYGTLVGGNVQHHGYRAMTGTCLYFGLGMHS